MRRSKTHSPPIRPKSAQTNGEHNLLPSSVSVVLVVEPRSPNEEELEGVKKLVYTRVNHEAER